MVSTSVSEMVTVSPTVTVSERECAVVVGVLLVLPALESLSLPELQAARMSVAVRPAERAIFLCVMR